MKLLLLMGFSLCCVMASAQKTPGQIPNALPRLPQGKIELLEQYLKNNPDRSNLLLMHQLKPGIYALPLDGMPCVVPELPTAGKILNAWQGKIAIPYSDSIIPNPALPNRVTPRSNNKN